MSHPEDPWAIARRDGVLPAEMRHGKNILRHLY
jgi:hypothetical protein